MDLGLSGLASGFDWRSLVDQLMDVERTPQARLRLEQTKIQERNNAYSSIKTQLNVLSNRLTTLKDSALFGARTVTSGDTSVATATASAGALVGRYTLNVSQLATTASQQGTLNAGRPLSATNDVSGLVLSEAGFASSITAGTLTINGKIITLQTADTLQSVFDQINTATGGAVTGSYDAATDTVQLASASPIVVGSTTDTSNFLQVAKLYNNGTGTLTSSSSLGSVKLGNVLGNTNLATPVSDGGSGAGQFKINGVEIGFNAATDTMSDVLKRINDSTAGVLASYDAANDRFTLTNKTTGDVGMALEEVSGNFLSATGLAGGTLQRGRNLLYTINGGGQLTSFSNTITQSSSGLTGLSITALKESSTTIDVGSDAAKMKSAINDFLTEYNKAQSMIDSQSATTTDSKGKVTAGILASDPEAAEIAKRLRRLVYAEIPGLPGIIRHLEKLGIASSGYDNSLTLKEGSKLDQALAENLSAVKDFFTNETSGLAVQLSSFLEKTVGDDGTLISHQTTLTRQSTDIDAQIVNLERLVQANRQRMINSFVGMETAQSQINQQLQFLQKRFGS